MYRQRFRILLVSNNSSVTDVVRATVEDLPNFELVGECLFGREGTHLLPLLSPQLVLLNSPLPDKAATTFIHKAKAVIPTLRVILIANRPEMIGYATARRKAADGFISFRLLKFELPLVLKRFHELVPTWGHRFSPWKEEYGMA